jgi:Family of unknown function (DUF5652)
MNDFSKIINDPVLMTVLFVILVWEFIWKGMAMWESARSGNKNWFIALLILNTAGILPIYYLLMHRRSNSGKTL